MQGFHALSPRIQDAVSPSRHNNMSTNWEALLNFSAQSFGECLYYVVMINKIISHVTKFNHLWRMRRLKVPTL